jgi:hypothetical protein
VQDQPTNPTKTVNINGASGSFTGTTSSFTIDPNNGGTWKIQNNDAATNAAGAYGTVYGNSADAGKYVGGVWKISDGTYKAAGGFQGKKQ